MKCLIAVMALLSFALIPGPTSAVVPDSVPNCPTGANLEEVHFFCNYAGDQFHELVTTHTEGISYRVKPMCVETQIVKETCINQQVCGDPPHTYKYMVFRSEDGGAYEPWGTVCLDTDTAEHFDVITPGRVLKEMRSLSWPEAELVIQPPNGRTLVNLKTNFLTTTTAPTSQTITLLGQQVEIEATPVEYTWHFGDGAELRGSDPGAVYPDLRVTHVYEKAHVTVSPSVDVTYQGRYRVNGEDWIPVPETLTVAGTPVSLEVVSATPHLVG
jgi:hypothetical protein